MVVALLIGAAAGAIYAIKQSPIYNAEISFILEDKASNGQVGVPSQINISLNNLTNIGNPAGNDNILTIIKSKRVINEILLTPVNGKTGQTLADLYLDIHYNREKWKRRPELINLHYADQKGPLSVHQDSLLADMHKEIVENNLTAERVSPKGSVFRLIVNSVNNDFSRLMAERIFSLATKVYQESKTKTELEIVNQLQQKTDTLRNNADLANLFAEANKNLEASKLVLAQQTPNIQLLDKPSYLLEDERKKMSFYVLIFSFSVLGLFVLYTLLFFIIRQIIKQ